MEIGKNTDLLQGERPNQVDKVITEQPKPNMDVNQCANATDQNLPCTSEEEDKKRKREARSEDCDDCCLATEDDFYCWYLICRYLCQPMGSCSKCCMECDCCNGDSNDVFGCGACDCNCGDCDCDCVDCNCGDCDCGD